jgi:hypothetical protein
MTEIKAQKDANRELRQQLVPLMASQKNAWDAVKQMREEVERTRQHYEEHVAVLQGKLATSVIGAEDERTRSRSTDSNGHLEQLAQGLMNSGAKAKRRSNGNGIADTAAAAKGRSSDGIASLRSETDDSAWSAARQPRTTGFSANGIVLDGDEDDRITHGNRGCSTFVSSILNFFSSS